MTCVVDVVTYVVGVELLFVLCLVLLVLCCDLCCCDVTCVVDVVTCVVGVVIYVDALCC